MSIGRPTDKDLHRAGLYGMGNLQGDPEVLADLGVPVDEATYLGHLASAAEAKTLLVPTDTPSATDLARQEAHEYYVKEFGIGSGPIVRKTPSESDASIAARDYAKSLIPPKVN